MAKSGELTPKQKAFCEYYVANGGNATEAAKQAGYSEKTASETGYENLNKPQIVNYIDQLQKPKTEARLATIEQRREWLRNVIEGKELDEVVTKDGDVQLVKPKTADRIRAMDLLGKTHGDFTEKVDLTTLGKSLPPTQIIIQAIATKAGSKADK
jgi:phage terminase small subunit